MAPTATFDLFADYFQFVVRDAGADWASLADAWTDEAIERMFVQGDGFVAVGTARNLPVPVTVRILAESPGDPPDDADRTNEGWLAVPSGVIGVTGITDNGLSGGQISVPPGRYDVRVVYRGLDTIADDGLRGHDRYEVLLWPDETGRPSHVG